MIIEIYIHFLNTMIPFYKLVKIVITPYNRNTIGTSWSKKITDTRSISQSVYGHQSL